MNAAGPSPRAGGVSGRSGGDVPVSRDGGPAPDESADRSDRMHRSFRCVPYATRGASNPGIVGAASSHVKARRP